LKDGIIVVSDNAIPRNLKRRELQGITNSKYAGFGFEVT
jgi:hypothetical protein